MRNKHHRHSRESGNPSASVRDAKRLLCRADARRWIPAFAGMTMVNRPTQFLILLSLILLTACGFHPVYGPTDSGLAVTDELNNVAIDGIPDRHGQMLRNNLIDRMYGHGRPPQPLYHLTVKLRGGEEDLGIRADATSTRSLLTVYADFDLKDAKGINLTHGTAHSAASFNKLTAEYGTMAARDSAYDRTLNEVSDQIVNRLSVFFASKNETHDSKEKTSSP